MPPSIGGVASGSPFMEVVVISAAAALPDTGAVAAAEADGVALPPEGVALPRPLAGLADCFPLSPGGRRPLSRADFRFGRGGGTLISVHNKSTRAPSSPRLFSPESIGCIHPVMLSNPQRLLESHFPEAQRLRPEAEDSEHMQQHQACDGPMMEIHPMSFGKSLECLADL